MIAPSCWPQALVLGLVALEATGCAPRESPDVALARAKLALVRGQIEGLQKDIARAERGELTTTDQIAIGISEKLTKELLNASLPVELDVADRVHVRVVSAEAGLRGTKAAVLFQARVNSIDVPGAFALVEIGGTIKDIELTREGRLRARPSLEHFAVHESGMGDLAANALDGLVRSNLDTISEALPRIEFPVELAHSITIPGLAEGPVGTAPGHLPLDIGVSQLIVGNRVLWILLRSKVGVWQAGPAEPDHPSTSKKATAHREKGR